ncbi:MAG: hypothetical protein RR290_02775 [Clostridia bacterium]
MNCCYTIVIKQIVCNNGVPKRIDNVHTNLSPNTKIKLEFGYSLTFLNGTDKQCSIMLGNDLFIPNVTFTILSGSFKIFDLPVPNSSYRLYVAARKVCCQTCNN